MRQPCLGLYQIELHDEVAVPGNLVYVRPELPGQLPQDAVDLPAFLLLVIEDVIVDADYLVGLDVGGAPGSRLIMNDATDLPLVFARYAEYPPAVAKALHRIAQVARPPVLLDDSPKGFLNLALLAAQQPPDSCQFIGRITADDPLCIDNGLDGCRKFRYVVYSAHHGVQLRIFRLPGEATEEGK